MGYGSANKCAIVNHADRVLPDDISPPTARDRRCSICRQSASTSRPHQISRIRLRIQWRRKLHHGFDHAHCCASLIFMHHGGDRGTEHPTSIVNLAPRRAVTLPRPVGRFGCSRDWRRDAWIRATCGPSCVSMREDGMNDENGFTLTFWSGAGRNGVQDILNPSCRDAKRETDEDMMR